MSQIFEETIGLCPKCLQSMPAKIVLENNQVWMTQECPRHGESRALIGSDSAEYRRLRHYVPDRSTSGGCCGSGESCGPPTCVLLLEITQACNLQCPTCYADAHGHDFMTMEQVQRRLEAFFKTQSRLDVLMLSGGEPTIHPQFAEILKAALAFPIERVLINTNGLRIGQSETLLQTLKEHRKQIELYFSFSSLQPSGHLHFYGRDLLQEKCAALDLACAHGIFTNIVITSERGVNDNETGDLFRFALSKPGIAGIVFQPVMDTGRYQHSYSPYDRMTLTGVLQELEKQTDGLVRSTDFVGLPCSHPDCCALTYGFLNADRTHFIPLPRHLDIARYLELFSDRISFSGLIKSAIQRVWSDLAHLRARRTLQDLATLFATAGIREALPFAGNPEQFGKRVFRVIVKPFMDSHTYDSKRIEQCCTKILTESGDAISFCEYNVFHRGRIARKGVKPLEMAK